uniref:Uncharacterized protein n=1 Tax=Glossina pallidipes TaxID=7398 RepID=A0A1B0AC65_GLOPL
MPDEPTTTPVGKLDIRNINVKAQIYLAMSFTTVARHRPLMRGSSSSRRSVTQPVISILVNPIYMCWLIMIIVKPPRYNQLPKSFPTVAGQHHQPPHKHQGQHNITIISIFKVIATCGHSHDFGGGYSDLNILAFLTNFC